MDVFAGSRVYAGMKTTIDLPAKHHRRRAGETGHGARGNARCYQKNGGRKSHQ